MGLIQSPENSAESDAAKLEKLVQTIRGCTVCSGSLPYPPRPVFQASASARLLIAGQAPGRKVHDTGIPWNDPSGDRLREWLQIGRDEFYGNPSISIIPAGFCYPGKGKGGDLPPRPECAPLWHPRLRELMPGIRLILPIGAYAQAYYLGASAKGSLADTVLAWEEYLPDFFPLPHPSPRNRRWFRMRPWFESEVVPRLRMEVRKALHPA